MRPLPLLALATLLGSFVFPWLQPEPVELLLAAAAVATLGLLRPAATLPAVAALGILIGLYSAARLPVPVRMRGECDAWLRVETAALGTRVDAWVASAVCDGKPVAAEGRVRLRFHELAPPPGTWVRVEGRATGIDPTRLPGEPDPIPAAIRAGVESQISVRGHVGWDRPPGWEPPATHAGLFRAMVDGDRSGIPEATRSLLRATGTWHLVSISGLHLGLIAAAAGAVGWVLSRPLTLLNRPLLARVMTAAIAALAAAMYADIAGWPLPALRAVWMVVGAGAVHAAGRRPRVLDLLALAAVAGVLAEAGAIDNPSFQLSYGAMLGIVLFPRRVLRLLPLDTPRLVVFLVGSLAGTLGATLGTLPVVAWTFQDLPALSPLANLWAVPWIATVATPAALLARIAPGDLGLVALAVADAACTVGLWGLAGLQGPLLHPAVGPTGALVLTGLVLFRKDLLGLCAALALILGLKSAPRQLEVSFFAIGQGDAALVRFPDGVTWLIDGGPGGDSLLQSLRRAGISALDDVFLSHPHADHLDGLLPVLASMPVARLHVPRLPVAGEASFYEAISYAEALWVGVHPLSRGELLHPKTGFVGSKKSKVNDESLVLLLEWGKHRFLFTGDIEAKAEAELAARLPDVDVLKLPHHGSGSSSTAPMLAANPEIVVVSCGWESRFRHPHPEALATWRGRQLYRTDRDGTVTVRSDGETLDVRRVAPPVRWPLDERRWP